MYKYIRYMFTGTCTLDMEQWGTLTHDPNIIILAGKPVVWGPIIHGQSKICISIPEV